MRQVFEVENIKCGGCVNSIRKGLEQLTGINAAQPDNEAGTVTVDFDEQSVSAAQITSKLAEMGYPLVGDNTLLRQAKSYVSCAIGRMSD